jgi:hypothetical protein
MSDGGTIQWVAAVAIIAALGTPARPLAPPISYRPRPLVTRRTRCLFASLIPARSDNAGAASVSLSPAAGTKRCRTFGQHRAPLPLVVGTGPRVNFRLMAVALIQVQ